MKILWQSNAPWVPSGYGQQTRIFAPRLNEHFDVAIFAQYGLQGDTQDWNGIHIYPGGYEAYGNDVILPWALDHFGGDPNKGWLFTLYDAWVYNNPDLNQLHNALWVPVDYDPLPSNVEAFFRQFDAIPVAMSKFGQRKLRDAGLDAFYIPHGIDPVFEPKPKDKARSAFNIPEDAFVVGMNANNKAGELHRKGYCQAFEGFARFSAEHPDAILYVHALADGLDGSVGWNLYNLAEAFGIRNKVIFTDQAVIRTGFEPELMPWLYSAFDVFLNPAYGEGFGIPIVEAQACGVPVVVTDHTAMPELVGDGWTVGGIGIWRNKMAAFWKIPDPIAITRALFEAYERTGLSEKAVKFAENYKADKVFEDHMLPVFKQLQERIDPA